MSIPEFMFRVRVGSEDWTWEDEYNHLFSAEVAFRTEQIEQELLDDGEQREPVLIGPDGRLWDGHHRAVILIGWYFGFDAIFKPDTKILVEFV